MAKNLKESSHLDNQIDIYEVINTLMESKIFIILSVLIFTISATLYSFSLKPLYKSSTIIEIGHYKMPNGTQKKIESPSNLIKGVKSNLKYKDQDNNSFQNISMSVLDSLLIRLETTSLSGEKNEKKLNRFINYLDERMTQQEKLILNDSLEPLLEKISEIESRIFNYKLNRKLQFKDTLSNLNNDLKVIENEILKLDDIIIEDSNSLALLEKTSQLYDLKIEKNRIIQEAKSIKEKEKLLQNDTLASDTLRILNSELHKLENELDYLKNRTIINTQIIRDIATNLVSKRTGLIIILGLFVGLFIGIFLVLIRNLVKNHRG